MDYPVVNIETAPEELNRLHGQIEGKLRSTVEDAIRAGEILTQVKERVGHGEFLQWVRKNAEFEERTAQRYMQLFVYRDKCVSVSDLQSAYKQVESLEAQAKRTESQRAADRVRHYLKTGEKLEGWRRGTDDKIVEEERARAERIEAAKAKMQEAADRREQEEKRRAESRASWSATEDMLRKAAEIHVEHSAKRRQFKERIKLSQSGESDAFIDALMDYLDEMENDSRRIEACQNIIKVCRNIAASLQVET